MSYITSDQVDGHKINGQADIHLMTDSVATVTREDALIFFLVIVSALKNTIYSH